MVVDDNRFGVKELEIRAEDIAEIRMKVRDYGDFKYLYHELELKNALDIELGGPYLIKTPEITFNGYPKDDGITIIQY